jgi:Flp pilus assembly protein TadD
MRNAIELDSTYWQAHRALGRFHAAAGRPDDARRHHQRAVELAGGIPSAMAGLARALVRDGDEEGARRILSQLEEDARRTGVHTPVVAAVRADLNDVDGAVEWLERAYRERHPALALMGADGPLADDPRYLDLQRRVGRRP